MSSIKVQYIDVSRSSKYDDKYYINAAISNGKLRGKITKHIKSLTTLDTDF